MQRRSMRWELRQQRWTKYRKSKFLVSQILPAAQTDPCLSLRHLKLSLRMEHLLLNLYGQNTNCEILLRFCYGGMPSSWHCFVAESLVEAQAKATWKQQLKARELQGEDNSKLNTNNSFLKWKEENRRGIENILKTSYAIQVRRSHSPSDPSAGWENAQKGLLLKDLVLRHCEMQAVCRAEGLQVDKGRLQNELGKALLQVSKYAPGRTLAQAFAIQKGIGGARTCLEGECHFGNTFFPAGTCHVNRDAHQTSV